jgi:hypothetical protein
LIASSARAFFFGGCARSSSRFLDLESFERAQYGIAIKTDAARGKTQEGNSLVSHPGINRPGANPCDLRDCFFVIESLNIR